MKKSAYLFIGGTIIGGIAITLINLSTNTVTLPSKLEAVSSKSNLNIVPDQSATNMQTEPLSDMQMRQAQSSEMPLNEMQSETRVEQNQQLMEQQTASAVDSLPGQTEIQAVQQVTVPAKAAPAAIPPTPEQIEQFKTMDNIISSAVNNPAIKLDDLIRQSSSLTIEQRGKLTQKALNLISRGELKLEQFNNKQPGS